MKRPKFLRPLFLLILFPPFFYQLAFSADDSGISVKAELDRAFITVGDPVEYTVAIRHDPSTELLSTIPPPDPEIFQIKKTEDIQREERGKKVAGKKFTLTAFRLGEFILEPIEIQYRKNGGDIQKLKTNRIFLTVKSVAEGEAKTDIRGVKSVMTIPRRFFNLFVLILITAFGVVAFLFYRYYRKQQTAALVPEVPLGPEDEALFLLNQLFESDLLRRDKVKEYYLKLSEILRIYFEKRYSIAAIEATTYEIMRLLLQKELPSPLKDKIKEVLESADLAKFAKWKPEPAQIIQLNQKSKQIVESCRPVEVKSGI